MQYIQYTDQKDLNSIIKRPVREKEDLFPVVRKIMDEVKNNGDRALINFSEKFDGNAPKYISLNKTTMEENVKGISDDLKDAIDLAIKNIKQFHLAQISSEIKIEPAPGVICAQRAVPIEKVGLYIPGGTAPLFSSVIMLAVPAVLAGCKKIVLITPPDVNGEIPTTIQYAALQSGLTTIYCGGGAQGIAALTYGTESIPKVDKILGPGNQFVTAAKQLAFLEGIAIDMPAGPSEVAVIADADANAAFVAADLLSQAEHGTDSQVLLIGTNDKKLNEIEQELNKQIKDLPRSEIAKTTLSKSLVVKTSDTDEAMSISNAYAPEHLILATSNARELATKVTNAGSVFIGALTPESAGDYASGTNHTLPTNRAATAFSGVNMDAFMKKITFQELSSEGVNSIGKAVITMAQNEQLQAHANAMQLRINNLKNLTP
ncbi:Histidinol dehydrogenase [Salinivirga cyanobacteriivorans]|uniref:Histidinol dehydrogenase n=1 Tax=Salinivirga cyanobacteriivorans TaxID=1307839 RepID=A0A0S2HZA2_9BACT|nr:histidinol dehydrogenase [Salinivirga cyanobacteriivorans]ALO15383.1 Histidinol dehydrogenase [Salinivirga cyanobacteriivorans]